MFILCYCFPLSFLYGNPYLRISSNPGNRIRVFPDFRQCAFVPLRFYGFVRKHRGASAVPCIRGRHAAVIPLATEEERTRLLAHGQARAAGQDIDPLPAVRLFTPDAHATWLLASLDPADGDTAYGLIDLGIGMPALGTVRLSDLASIVGPRQRPVMRDRYFQPTRRLSEYVRLAQEDGSIPD